MVTGPKHCAGRENKLRIEFHMVSASRMDPVWVAVMFGVSRLHYAILGLHFDASTFPGYMQFIDPELLTHHLIESLFYYHANPPLLNLFTGIGLKLFGPSAAVFFCIAFHALGLALALCVYMLTRALSGSRLAAMTVTVLIEFSPAFVLYENWFMYTFPATALLCISAWCLFRYVETGNARWCAAFFWILALLLLTRSLFHLAWFMLVAALLALFQPRNRREVLLMALAPFLVTALWYGKNFLLFGSFSSSTWLGIGMSNIATLMVPRTELEPFVANHQLSRYALVSRYEQTNDLFAAAPHTHPDIPVLDQVFKSSGGYNFNNESIVVTSPLYRHDALFVIRHFTGRYFLGLLISNRLFFSSSDLNLYFDAHNRAAALRMDEIFDPLFYITGTARQRIQQPHFGFHDKYYLEVNSSLLLFLVWWIVLGYGYWRARHGILYGNTARGIVAGFIVLTAVYVYAVGTTLELAENYRYRFLVEPLFLVLEAAAVTAFVRTIRVRTARPSP